MNAGIEHDYVTNTLVKGDESHRLGNLTHMFQLMAQQVRDAHKEADEDLIDGDSSIKESNLCIPTSFTCSVCHYRI